MIAALRILIIDDDVALCRSLARLLRFEGVELTAMHHAEDGFQHASSGEFQLVVLDVMLPGGDGRLLLRKLRTVSDVPVIMLTARGDELDRIAGLEAGADDYLPKPFNARELVARIRAILKRGKRTALVPKTLSMGDLEIHPLSRRVLQRGAEVLLTGAEFEILMLLVKSDGRIVSRDELAELCLGRPVGPFDRSVDNHISNLRKKLGATCDGVERIRNVRGAGYSYTGRTQELGE
jgi:two-component system response regulator CpxR